MTSENGGSTELQSSGIGIAVEQQRQSQEDENSRSFAQNPNRPSPLPQASEMQDNFAEISMNMALYDPPRWGWTALGGISDVLSPHERSRRYSTCKAYKTKKRTRRQRKSGMICVGTTKLASTAAAAASVCSQLKDPPSYSIIASKAVVDDIVSEHQNQSRSSQPESSEAASKSISEDTPPQKDETKESNSDSKTSNNTKETTIPKTIVKPEASAGEGNDSTSSQQKAQRQESDVKTQIPPESDTTVQQNAETKETLDKSSTETISVLPREEPKIDIGLETAGISTNILGLTIEKQQQQQSATENDTNNDPEDETRKQEGNPVGRRSKKYIKKSRRSLSGVVSRTKYDCHVLSMGIPSSADVETADNKVLLDMYAYHQGREGMEPRDAETGELLVSQQVTDTNHDFDAPKSTFPIEIEFPLEDEEDEDFLESGVISHTNARLESEIKNSENDENFRKSGHDNNNHITTTTTKSTGKSSKKKNLAMYRETLTWDLIDPNTPTPLAYASAIGKEYGLSFGQTMDLAAKIDKQIQKHVTETSQYREAIATRDTIQELSQPRKLGPVCQPYRYDEIVQRGKEGGAFRPKRERHSRQPRSSACGGALVSKKNRKDRISGTTETLAKACSTAERNKTKKNAPSISDVSLEDELDDDLLEEVKKRATAEPIAVSGVLKAEKNVICHICKKRMPVGYHFPCSNSSHVYCDMHVEKRLGITKEAGEYKYESCPVCTLTCECAKCVRKLKNVATLLKAKSIEQMKQPHEVDYPGILSICMHTIPSKELDRATDLVLEKKRKEIKHQREEIARQQREQSERENAQQPQKGDGKSLEKAPDRMKSRTILLVGQTMVPRPPLSDFPRELHNGIDFDANATCAYFTVYSAEGKRTVDDVPNVWLDEENRTKAPPETSQLSKIKYSAEVPEDGNVDYCHICKTAGHLILCDFCPRGFHQDCLKTENQSSPDGDHWECFVCRNEQVQSGKDFVDGKESMEKISLAFELDPDDERAVVGLEVLSIIHQMLTHLLDYDFGYTFEKPVDTSSFPEYTDIVKHPMDIGTIRDKLENGDFAKLLNGTFLMDDLVTKVLNDIELIWRNCIMFNVIGSSVARMALVLRRRVKMICRRCIFSKLSDDVKKNVTRYARKFDEAWASGITENLSNENDDSMSADSWKLSAIENMKPISNHQFASKKSNGSPIAILDSVSGRVVKLYSSAKSASKAVEIILKAGHRCEWNASASRTDLNCKLIAEKSRTDPNSLCFGYRWLFLDDLNEGRVTFFKAVCDFVEMRHDEFTFVFRSIEEALSSSRLSKTVNIHDLRTKLSTLPRNGDWTEIEGVKWRRPAMPEKRDDSFKESITTAEHEDVEMGANLVSDSDSLPSWKNCSFLKKDLVTDQILVGFDSIQVAHQDWMQSALSSPSFPSTEAQTMENFNRYYLDGDRNVDGMIWQTVENGHRMDLDEKTVENTNKENLTSMEIGDNGGSDNIKLESSDRGENTFLSKSGESKSQSSMNYSLSSSAIDDQQRAALDNHSATGTLDESPGASGKRKVLNDDDIEFPASKESRLSIVFVE